jgi:hypothetical protein
MRRLFRVEGLPNSNNPGSQGSRQSPYRQRKFRIKMSAVGMRIRAKSKSKAFRQLKTQLILSLTGLRLLAAK